MHARQLGGSSGRCVVASPACNCKFCAVSLWGSTTGQKRRAGQLSMLGSAPLLQLLQAGVTGGQVLLQSLHELSAVG